VFIRSDLFRAANRRGLNEGSGRSAKPERARLLENREVIAALRATVRGGRSTNPDEWVRGNNERKQYHRAAPTIGCEHYERPNGVAHDDYVADHLDNGRRGELSGRLWNRHFLRDQHAS
jgi:hypothetical protein